MIELYDIEDSGDDPGNLVIIKEALEWEISLKNALMESQERLAKRVKILEIVLEGILERFEDNSTSPAYIAAMRVLKNCD